MAEYKAGVVVVQRFCSAKSRIFQKYLDYLDREEAIRKDHDRDFNLFHEYMENPEKSTGLFSSAGDELDLKEKTDLKRIFQTAQDHDSLMWQTVISFDNRFLKENNLYEPASGKLDERRMKEYVRSAVDSMLKEEKMENAVWCASFHYNTDNIHVHIATVEPIPLREKKKRTIYQYKAHPEGEYIRTSSGEYLKRNSRNYLDRRGIPYQRYQREPVRDKNGNPREYEDYVGRFKIKSISKCKSSIVNDIINQREQNRLINQMIRDTLIPNRKQLDFSKDKEIRDAFLDLYDKMPDIGDRGLWNYNNSIMKPLRAEIDKITTLYLEKYDAEAYQKLKDTLSDQAKRYASAYGDTGRDYSEGKLKELYERMGNITLKEIRGFHESLNRQAISKTRTYEKGTEKKGYSSEKKEQFSDHSSDEKKDSVVTKKPVETKKHEVMIGRTTHGQFRYELEKSLRALKNGFKNTKDKYLNEEVYKRMERDAEKKKYEQEYV